MEYTHNRLDRLELVTAKKAKCKTTFLAVFLEQLHFQILVYQIAKCIEKAVCVLPKTIFIRSHTRLLKPKPIKQLNTFLYIDRHSPPNSTNFLFATSKWNNQWQVLTNDFIPLNLICNSFRITFIIFLHYHLIIFLCTSTTNKNRCSKQTEKKAHKTTSDCQRIFYSIIVNHTTFLYCVIKIGFENYSVCLLLCRFFLFLIWFKIELRE